MNVTKTFYFFNHYKCQPVVLIDFKKMIFQRIPCTNVWGHKFDFAVKRSKVIFGLFLISLVD